METAEVEGRDTAGTELIWEGAEIANVEGSETEGREFSREQALAVFNISVLWSVLVGPGWPCLTKRGLQM